MASSASAIAEAAASTPFDATVIDSLIKRRDAEGWHALEESEIDMLVSYLAELGTTERIHVERTRAMLEHEQMLRDMTASAYDRSRRTLERVCAALPTYEEVCHEQA